MESKIIKLQKELKAQVIWSQNVDQKEVINKNRFDMYAQKVANDLYILDRYIEKKSPNDYNFIVENILPDYEIKLGDGQH